MDAEGDGSQVPRIRILFWMGGELVGYRFMDFMFV